MIWLPALQQTEGFVNPQLSSTDSTPQIDVDIDRDRALELGILPSTVCGCHSGGNRWHDARQRFP